MGLLVVGFLVLLAGAAVVVAGAALVGPSMSLGSRRVTGYGLMTLGVGLMCANSITVISVGEVGVKHFLGMIDEDPLAEGVHFVNPFASIEKMSVREQSFPPDGGVERFEAQTSEQLNVALEVALLFTIDGAAAPRLYQEIGTETQLKSRILLNALRNGVRDAVATKSINEIFSPDRREVAASMQQEIQLKAGNRIEILDVFVRDVQAPPSVREAIESKLQREQQVAAEEFQTQIVQEQAQQEIERARGIAESQKIITEGLTPEYLTYHYIQKLGELPAGSVVYVPTEAGIPLIRNLGGGNR